MKLYFVNKLSFDVMVTPVKNFTPSGWWIHDDGKKTVNGAGNRKKNWRWSGIVSDRN